MHFTIQVLPENTFQGEGAIKALYFFTFRVSGKYQTISFRLTVVLLPELEMVKQWQVFIKPLLRARYNICNN